MLASIVSPRVFVFFAAVFLVAANSPEDFFQELARASTEQKALAVIDEHFPATEEPPETPSEKSRRPRLDRFLAKVPQAQVFALPDAPLKALLSQASLKRLAAYSEGLRVGEVDESKQRNIGILAEAQLEQVAAKHGITAELKRSISDFMRLEKYIVGAGAAMTGILAAADAFTAAPITWETYKYPLAGVTMLTMMNGLVEWLRITGGSQYTRQSSVEKTIHLAADTQTPLSEKAHKAADDLIGLSPKCREELKLLR